MRLRFVQEAVSFSSHDVVVTDAAGAYAAFEGRRRYCLHVLASFYGRLIADNAMVYCQSMAPVRRQVLWILLAAKR